MERYCYSEVIYHLVYLLPERTNLQKAIQTIHVGAGPVNVFSNLICMHSYN